MLIAIHKKCSICKEFMSLELEKNDIVWNKTYMHFNCYVQKEFNKRGNKLSEEQVKDKIKKIQQENENHVFSALLKDSFYRWIQQSYGIVSIPTYFFQKIDSVITGEYKGLTSGICLEDLFDMWKRKKQELDKIAMNNVSKGNGMDNVMRLGYDLAILVNKYDSYLKWKNKQKLLINQIEEENKEQKIDFNKINKTIEVQQTESTDINDILDEIF
jgi:hypothetical protein